MVLASVTSDKNGDSICFVTKNMKSSYKSMSRPNKNTQRSKKAYLILLTATLQQSVDMKYVEPM